MAEVLIASAAFIAGAIVAWLLGDRDANAAFAALMERP